jgi:hypothetical protein
LLKQFLIDHSTTLAVKIQKKNIITGLKIVFINLKKFEKIADSDWYLVIPSKNLRQYQGPTGVEIKIFSYVKKS